MKTSNKLLTVAALLIVAYLVIYNFELKAQFQKGDYKSRFYGYTQFVMKDFDVIEDNITSSTDVIIEQGNEYKVWINTEVEGKFKVDVRNARLNLNYKGGESYPTVVYVICPRLSKLKVNWNVRTDDPYGQYGGNISINNFKQDTMNIYGRGLSLMHMSGNTIGKLNVDIGGGSIMLGVGNTNKIGNGIFNIRDQARFELLGPVVEKPVYHIEDNATLTVTGQSLRKAVAL